MGLGYQWRYLFRMEVYERGIHMPVQFGTSGRDVSKGCVEKT